MRNISAGEIHMRPRWHFVLLGTLSALGVLFGLAVTAYVVSFMVFVLRINGVLMAPRFGMRGIVPFLLSFPWTLLIIGALLIAIVEVLVRKFSFSYRKPVIYSVIGVVALSLVGSVVVAELGIHQRAYRTAEGSRVPGISRMYQGYAQQRMQHIHVGEITEVVSPGFHIQNPRGHILTIIVTASTTLPQVQLNVGDTIAVLGERVDDTVSAIGIQYIADDDIYFDRSMRMRGGGMMRGVRPVELPR